mmetsp:Transcript_7270/g.11604  ORF Transcript_7270/g.11604 Transcript_7270/m.11604 type:complete len:494 (+) Transcript_7270:1444-2925(+)
MIARAALQRRLLVRRALYDSSRTFSTSKKDKFNPSAKFEKLLEDDYFEGSFALLEPEQVDQDPEGFVEAEEDGVDPVALAKVNWRVPIPIPDEVGIRLRKSLEGRRLEQLAAFHNKLTEKRDSRLKSLVTGHFCDPIRYSYKESLGYLAFDTVPAYSITTRILEDTFARFDPDKLASFDSMLDFGSGPGTAVLAARNTPELQGLKEVTMVEPSQSMHELANELIKGKTDYRRPLDELLEDLEQNGVKSKDDEFGLLWSPNLQDLVKGVKSTDVKQYDVVTAMFTLSELPSFAARAVALGILWRMTKPGGLLIVAERGDPMSMSVVQDARRVLLEEREDIGEIMKHALKLNIDQGVQDDYGLPSVVAPCTHDAPCPLHTVKDNGKTRFKRSCHFQQFSERSITTRGKMGQGLGRRASPFQYSYISFTKQDKQTNRPLGGGRLIRTPLKKSKHVIVDVCGADGELHRLNVTKSKSTNTKAYKAARRGTWGGIWIS